MVKGIGIDIAPIERLETMLARYDRETLLLIFTPGELDRAEKAPVPTLSLVLCFSAKEAMSKALGTGFSTIDWHEIESEVIGAGQIRITLSGKALRLGSKRIHLGRAGSGHCGGRVRDRGVRHSMESIYERLPRTFNVASYYIGEQSRVGKADAPAYLYDGGSLTYRQLQSSVSRMAALLQEWG